ELSAGALVDTGVGGDEPADFHGVRLPLAAIARQLDQGGVLLEGIDVVVEGRRAVDGPAGDVYSALVGPLPLISRRRVILLARFDIIRLASDAVDGGEDALQQIVTVATERLRRALVHHGIPCRVLDATELAEMYLASEAAPPAGGRRRDDRGRCHRGHGGAPPAPGRGPRRRGRRGHHRRGHRRRRHRAARRGGYSVSPAPDRAGAPRPRRDPARGRRRLTRP